MSALTRDQWTALARICRAVVDTVKEAGPMGAPGGLLYAALIQYGCTLSQFESLMAALVSKGYVRKEGDCYVTP